LMNREFAIGSAKRPIFNSRLWYLNHLWFGAPGRR
jgi:hypothetical protein